MRRVCLPANVDGALLQAYRLRACSGKYKQQSKVMEGRSSSSSSSGRTGSSSGSAVVSWPSVAVIEDNSDMGEVFSKWCAAPAAPA